MFRENKLDNVALVKWFNESDSWWFDNVRFNAEKLEDPHKRALALTLGMMVGDYVLLLISRRFGYGSLCHYQKFSARWRSCCHSLTITP